MEYKPSSNIEWLLFKNNLIIGCLSLYPIKIEKHGLNWIRINSSNKIQERIGPIKIKIKL